MDKLLAKILRQIKESLLSKLGELNLDMIVILNLSCYVILDQYFSIEMEIVPFFICYKSESTLIK